MAWSASSLPNRPGVYTNFEDNAEAPIQGGVRGVVAIPLTTYTGTAEAEKVYEVERKTRANELFGEENVESIEMALTGGASLVVVYTLPEETAELTQSEIYDAMLDKLAVQDFNVLVLDQLSDATLQDKVLSALSSWRDEDKHVFAVFGGDAAADADPATGNTRSGTLEDDYSVNLISGVERLETEYSSAEYAPFIAGRIAGLGLDETLTYKTTNANDVTYRMRNSEISTAIDAGSLVLVNDGRNVKVEKGITTTGEFIRSIAVRQAILTDLPLMLQSNVVAQIDNSEDGRQSVVSMIKRYLETLVAEGAISGDEGEEPDAYVDPENEPTQDAAFFVVEYTDQYSLERVFLTVNREG